MYPNSPNLSTEPTTPAPFQNFSMANTRVTGNFNENPKISYQICILGTTRSCSCSCSSLIKNKYTSKINWDVFMAQNVHLRFCTLWNKAAGRKSKPIMSTCSYGITRGHYNFFVSIISHKM